MDSQILNTSRHRKDIDLSSAISSLHAGVAERISEPYGYDPLAEWKLENGDIHYTYLALQEGYTHNLATGEYMDPDGTVVAENTEIWEGHHYPSSPYLNTAIRKEMNLLANGITQWLPGSTSITLQTTSGHTLGEMLCPTITTQVGNICITTQWMANGLTTRVDLSSGTDSINTWDFFLKVDITNTGIGNGIRIL